MKAEDISLVYSALRPDGAVVEIKFNQEIAATLVRLPDDPSLYFDLSVKHFLVPLRAVGQRACARKRHRQCQPPHGGGGERQSGETQTPHGSVVRRRAVACGGWELDFVQRASLWLAGDTLLTGHI